MREIKELKTHIVNYGKTREIYSAYRKAKYPDEFYQQHRADIEMHLAAKRAFDELGVKKLPSLAQLNTEFSELSAHKFFSECILYIKKFENTTNFLKTKKIFWRSD